MNKNNAKDFLPIVQALAEGKVIQYKSADEGWKDVEAPVLNMLPDEYRVKPEPRRIWVNEWKDGEMFGHETKMSAKKAASRTDEIKRIAVEYVEVIP